LLFLAFDVCLNFDVVLSDIKIDVGNKIRHPLTSVVENTEVS